MAILENVTGKLNGLTAKEATITAAVALAAGMLVKGLLPGWVLYTAIALMVMWALLAGYGMVLDARKKNATNSNEKKLEPDPVPASSTEGS